MTSRSVAIALLGNLPKDTTAEPGARPFLIARDHEANKTRNSCYPADLMATKTCRVSFKDLDGIRHSAEVQAETLYEAAVLGLKALKNSEWIETVGAGTRIDI